MTLEDAGNLCDVFITADGGCPSCTDSLCEYANKFFPEFQWRHHDDRVIVTHGGRALTGRTYEEVSTLVDDFGACGCSED